VDQVERAILDAMAGGKGLSNQEIAAEIKLSTRATRTRLLALVARGLVVEVGTSPQDPTRKYFLVKRG
jgi:predicted ArsR family transcriptional regulator